jgi:hypothetical protein
MIKKIAILMGIANLIDELSFFSQKMYLFQNFSRNWDNKLLIPTF